jgi:diguanylate cyclase (GGDEF)-like protein
MTSATRPKFFTRPLLVFSTAITFLAAVGVWLAYDFWRERERAVAEVARVAMYQSRLISTLFGDTLLTADFVLRDIAGHVDLALARKTPLASLAPLVEAKLGTVPGLTDLVLLDEHCRFVALGRNKDLLGTKSRQSFCSAPSHVTGQSLHIQYMPVEKSVNREPVVLVSRVIASPQGRMRATAMAVLELNYAQRWLESFAVDRLDVLTLLDTNGILIARNPPLPDRLGNRSAPPAGVPPFDQARGTTTFTAHSPLDQQERVYGLSRLERFPFVALVGYDKARALAGWRQRAWQFALAYAALVVLSLALLRAHLQAVAQGRALHALATTDALTGIANRRQLLDIGEQETRRAQRYGKPLAVLMIDVDRFKQINDRWGHPSGDRVICHIADQLRGTLRAVDSYGRLGGEEFAAILPETDAAGAIQVAERLRLAIEASETARADDGQVIRHTASIGVVALKPDDADFEALLQRADRALYRAKASGRNTVATA